MWGLVCNQDIYPGQCVIEYVGELVNQSESENRGKAYDDPAIGVFYLFDLNHNIEKIDQNEDFETYVVDDYQFSDRNLYLENFPLAIDAFFYGNHARFINHSCDSNLFSLNIHSTEHICYNRIFFSAN